MRATMAQQIAINTKLKEVCKSVDGLCTYAEGWNDVRIANETGVSAANVVYVRKQMGYGTLAHTPSSVRKDTTELQALVVRLIQGFEGLTKQHQKLAARVEALEGTRRI